MYKLVNNFDGTPHTSVLRLEDNSMIPFHENNTDYQEYLRWIDGYTKQYNTTTHQMEYVLTTPGGNTPLPADE